MWRGEQPIDHAIGRVWRLIALEDADLVRRWRQTDQIERHAPQPGAAIRWRRWSETCALKPLQDKAVDRSPRPGRIVDRRRNARLERLKRPELPRRLKINLRRRRDGPRAGAISRIDRPAFDPLFEIRD